MATEYVVLGSDEQLAEQPTGAGGVHWLVVASEVTASNDRQAIREATKGLSAEERSGTFVAVPPRSWTPRTRAIETREVDRWS